MANFSSLKIQAELALSKLTEGKRYILGDVNDRLQKVATTYPQDTVIKAMASVIENMCHKGADKIISQGEIGKIYQDLVGLNASGTKFREVLGDLLISDNTTPETNKNHIQTIRDTDAEPMKYDINTETQKTLDKMFGLEADRYDPHNAAAGKRKVELELMSMGYNTARVRIAGGNSNFLVFAADLDTNRGAVRVYIPANASGEQLPSVFVAGDKFEELTPSALKEHLNEAAQRSNYLPKVSAILNSLNILTGNVSTTVSNDNFEKSATNLPSANGSNGLSSPGLFGSLPDPNKNMKEIHIPNTPMPAPLKALASDIEERIMESAVGFPQATVRLTKRMLVAELNSMGFKGSQIRVSAPTSDGFICEAILNTPNGKTTIEVPIEMRGNAPLLPSVFAKGDFVSEFNTQNLRAFVMNESGAKDSPVLRQYANLDNMGFTELKNMIVKSAIDGDLQTCDEVLAVIGEKFDENTYRNVIADYHKMLLNIKTASETIKMAYEDKEQFYMTPNSMYPVHKKLGKPVNELIRDEFGTYHLKSTYMSRQNQKECSVLFNTAKILVGD